MARRFDRYIRLLEYRGFAEGFLKGGFAHNILFWDRWAMPPISNNSTDQIGRETVRASFVDAMRQYRKHG